ncbi:MAG: hypothetical protein PSX81_14125 [bacterium]|nr:hypothetical protein [bacterium]
MNQVFLNQINQDLIKSIKAKYQMDDSKVLAVSEAGKASIISSLKSFVIKNGTTEIESVLLNKSSFNGTSLQKFCFQNFEKDIADKKILSATETNEVAEFSINYLIDRFKLGFVESGNSKDLDGICKFLDIDKKLLNLVNSPVGKILGKFFK